MNNEKSRGEKPSVESRGKPVQFIGRSVEDALNQAAERFGVPVARLDFEVVKDTTFSILGFVRKGEAVVNVWPPEGAPYSDSDEDDEIELEAATYSQAPARVLDEDEDEDEIDASAGLQENPPELEDVAVEVLATLLDKMGLIAAVEVVDQGGEYDAESGETTPMVLNAVGDDLGVLIGRRGDTLRDVQYITRLIISRQQGAWPNVVVDVEGYKEKRATSLQALAKRMADEVRRTRRPAVLEPMPANERRIVHLTLRHDPDVYTESTGEDDSRKVQILPR